MILRYYNTVSTIIGRTISEKITKKVNGLNDTIYKLVLPDIHREIHPTTKNSLYSLIHMEYNKTYVRP